jgi:acyl carrier protein
MDKMRIDNVTVYNDILGILDKLSEDWEYSEDVTPETYLISDLGFESIDLVVLGTTIEKKYDKKLPFARFFAELGLREIKDIRLGELVDFVYQNLNSHSEPIANG